jgi:hypothetical protein
LKAAYGLIAGLALAALAAPAFGAGADVNGALPNSALALPRNAAIKVTSEHIYVSDKAVRVTYSVVNTSTKDVTAPVVFPIPDVIADGPEDGPRIPDPNSPNFLDFHITVDGQPVQALIVQQAVLNGVNETAYLAKLGLPVSPYFDAVQTTLDRMPKAQQDLLIKQGLAMELDPGGDGSPRTLMGTWTLKTSFSWSQTFPAGRAVTIEHDYAPSVGTPAVIVGTAASMVSDLKQYCVDSSFTGVATKLLAGTYAGPNLSPEFIGYGLAASASWAAQVGDFQLVIDKGSPAAVVSFCGTGVAKAGPTTFVVHYANFTPTTDVQVLLLEPPPAN